MAKTPAVIVPEATQEAKNAANGLGDVHFVGLKKVGPMKYAVVTGTLNKPVMDNVAQPLEYAAEAAKLAWHKLLDVVP